MTTTTWTADETTFRNAIHTVIDIIGLDCGWDRRWPSRETFYDVLRDQVQWHD